MPLALSRATLPLQSRSISARRTDLFVRKLSRTRCPRRCSRERGAKRDAEEDRARRSGTSCWPDSEGKGKGADASRSAGADDLAAKEPPKQPERCRTRQKRLHTVTRCVRRIRRLLTGFSHGRQGGSTGEKAEARVREGDIGTLCERWRHGGLARAGLREGLRPLFHSHTVHTGYYSIIAFRVRQ